MDVVLLTPGGRLEQGWQAESGMIGQLAKLCHGTDKPPDRVP